MGRIFKTFIDTSLKKQCMQCYADLYEDGNFLTVETHKGKAIFLRVSLLNNFIEQIDISKISYLQMSNSINMFDDDICLPTNETEFTTYVHCKICFNHLGWKFNDHFIILT